MEIQVVVQSDFAVESTSLARSATLLQVKRDICRQSRARSDANLSDEREIDVDCDGQLVLSINGCELADDDTLGDLEAYFDSLYISYKLSNSDEFELDCSNYINDYSNANITTERCNISCIFLRASYRSAVIGGKGGFGALLRQNMKQKKGKQTTDFGACRDLNGRRLRDINNEVLLTRWKEAKDNGKEFDPNEETPSGIDNWYLPTPTWADDIKVDKHKHFRARKEKTDLCSDWLASRSGGREPPKDAPHWWGCPRGKTCTFAHGEKELRGGPGATEAHRVEQQNLKRDAFREELEEYVSAVDGVYDEDELVGKATLIGALVRESLQKSKKRREINAEDANNGNSGGGAEGDSDAIAGSAHRADELSVHSAATNDLITVADKINGEEVSDAKTVPTAAKEEEREADDELPLDDYGF